MKIAGKSGVLLIALVSVGAATGCATPNVRLVRAINRGDVAEARRLMAAEKIDVNATVEYDTDLYDSAFTAAVGARIPELVQRMLSAGADVNVVEDWDEGEYTALAMLMLSNTRFAWIPDVALRAEDEVGNTYSDKASVQWRIFSLARLLLAAGADPKPVFDNGNTVLHLLLNNTDRCLDIPGVLLGQMAFELLEKGAPADMPNREGQTPLWLAVRCGHAEPVEMLVRAGADVAVVAADGQDLCTLAKRGLPREGPAPALEALAGAGMPCAQALRSARVAEQEELARRKREMGADPDRETWARRMAQAQADERAQAARAADEAVRRANAQAIRDIYSGKGPRVRTQTVTVCHNPAQVACGQYCCGTGTMCCAAEDRSDTAGGFCMPIRQGHGCPWGTRNAR